MNIIAMEDGGCKVMYFLVLFLKKVDCCRLITFNFRNPMTYFSEI